MGACSSLNVDGGPNDRKNFTKSELRELEDRIAEIDNFMKLRDSEYTFTENAEITNDIIMRSIGTIAKIHEYAEILYKRLLVLRDKTEKLLKDKQKSMAKLVYQLRGPTHNSVMKLPQYSNSENILGEDLNSTFVGEWNSGQKRILTNLMNESERAKQNQSLQAIIEKTMELLHDLKDKSGISNSEKNILQELLKKWTRDANIMEEVQKVEKEKERLNEKREESQKKRAEETNRKEEEERKSREEEEIRKKEDEEKQRKLKEEKRIKREEEERKRREEELRRKVEAEEQKRREEQEQKRREEQEKKRREEQEKKRREEQEQKRREEQEKKRREEQEKKKREEEKKRRKVEAEEQKRREEQEQKRREEQEKKRREEQEQKRREEQEKKRREEQEQKRREEQEKKRREEQEKKRREVEKKRRKVEADEQKRREEQEQKRREEQEKKRREEQEQKRREEQEKKRREEQEKKRREEEKKRSKEEDEKERQRLDPVNWEPFIYIIQDQHLIDEYNDGVCCVVCAIPNELNKDDLCCSSFGNNGYNIRDCINDEEQVASLMINIQTNSGKECILERPLRIYIPHRYDGKGNREVSVKVSINEGRWRHINTLDNYTLTGKEAISFAGIEIEKFSSVKIVAVTIIKPERITVTENGMKYKCIRDKDISVVFPESVFKEPTQVHLTLNTVPKTDLKSAKENHNNLSRVVDSTSLISIDCCASTEGQFHVTVKGLRKIGSSDRFVSIYKEREGEWKFTDQKIKDTEAYITIPPGVSNIRLIGLTLPRNTPNIHVFDSANEMVKHSNETMVQVICKQKNSNWNDTHIACVAADNKTRYTRNLMDDGYSDGPAPSREFCVTEGENVDFWCSGNIEAELPRSSLCFLRNFQDCLSCHLSVRDFYIQKQEHYYRGYLQFKVDDSVGSQNNRQRKDQLCLYLEKQDVPKKSTSYSTKFKLETKVTALIKYISWKLTLEECQETWDRFVHCLDTENIIRRLKKRIDRDYQYDTSRKKCEEFMKLWIREKEKSINKIGVITSALKTCQLDDLEFDARRFLDFYDGILSDISLFQMADKIGVEWEILGIHLHLTTAEIDQIKMDNPNARSRIIHMLDNWRISDHAIECHLEIILKFVEALRDSGCDSELITVISQTYPNDFL